MKQKNLTFFFHTNVWEILGNVSNSSRAKYLFRVVFFSIDLLDQHNRKKKGKFLSIHSLAEFLSEKGMGPTPHCRAKWHFVNNDLIYFPFKPFKETLSILAELVHHLNFFCNIGQNYIKMLSLD